MGEARFTCSRDEDMGLQSSPSRERNRPSTLFMAGFLFLPKEDRPPCAKDHLHDDCKTLSSSFVLLYQNCLL